MLKAHSRLFEHLTLSADLLLIAGCWMLAYAVRFRLFDHGGDIPPFSGYALQLLPILVVWGFAFRAFDLYRPNRLGSRVSEWLDVAKASTLGVLVLVAIMTFAFRGHDYSRLVIILFWAESVVAVSFSRAVFREALRLARRRGYNQRYAIVVGGGEPAAEVLRVLRRRPDVGIRILGLLSDKREVPDDVRWLGGIDDVRAILDRHSIDVVFIALPLGDYSRLSEVLGGIGEDPVAIYFAPDVFGLVPARGGVEEFETVPFIHLRQAPLYGWNRVLKRGFDLVFGALALALASPAMLAIAVGGEMSLVGPRPERPSFVEEFRRRVPGYMLRHKMKAGITGWAQINGWRGNTSIEKRIEYDLYYIERWSFSFDLKILIQTLLSVFRINRNAY